MFTIKSESGNFKTLNIEKVFKHLIETQDKEIKYFFEFILHTQQEFFKVYLRISGSYDNYLKLELKFNPPPTLEEYGSKHDPSKNI